jgi:hypothetical protein
MPTINQLTAVDTVTASDLIPIWSSTDGDARKTSAYTLKTYLTGGVSVNDGLVTQTASPAATAFNISVTVAGTWLIITPVAVYATGTITLPFFGDVEGGQIVQVNCSQAVTALTVNGNGASVIGAPTTLTANSFFTLRYRADTLAWYRVA